MFLNYFRTIARYIRKSKVNFVFKLGGISFLLVISSAAYPSWMAGRTNPVDVIRSE